MAKKNNDMTLSPSEGEGLDAWGAACGFTSWVKAAEAIGITVAQMVTIRKKTPRKTIRLAMAAIQTSLLEKPAGRQGEAVAWQHKRRPSDYPDEWQECSKEVFDMISRTPDSPWIARELFTHPTAPVGVPDVDTAELRRALAAIRVVMELDGYDLIRRKSVLNIIDQRIAAAPSAQQGVK